MRMNSNNLIENRLIMYKFILFYNTINIEAKQLLKNAMLIIFMLLFYVIIREDRKNK